MTTAATYQLVRRRLISQHLDSPLSRRTTPNLLRTATQYTAPVPPAGAVGKQVVALRITGKTAVFYDCLFVSGQDTLYDHQGRQYFQDCYRTGGSRNHLHCFQIDIRYGGRGLQQLLIKMRLIVPQAVTTTKTVGMHSINICYLYVKH